MCLALAGAGLPLGHWADDSGLRVVADCLKPVWKWLEFRIFHHASGSPEDRGRSCQSGSKTPNIYVLCGGGPTSRDVGGDRSSVAARYPTP